MNYIKKEDATTVSTGCCYNLQEASMNLQLTRARLRSFTKKLNKEQCNQLKNRAFYVSELIAEIHRLIKNQLRRVRKED